jgi:Na+-translocating ferredoxin:NAD+ oxidoreductase RnfG subunit/NAD-dependent dihydropyrimidine dehydrogenase PreA subunit
MSFNRYTRLFPRLVSFELPGQLLLNPLLLCFLFLSFLLITLFSQSLLAQPARQPVEGNPVRTPFTTELQPEWLLQVLPGAESFSEKEGEPPVYRGYRQNPENGQQELVGYVFLSADVPPEERGYSAPLDMLIGVNTDNQVSGFKLLDYVESYTNTIGDFAADPVFQAQLQNKHVADEFRLLRDIDGIAGATVTSFAITRGVREAARRVAEAHNNFVPGNPVDRARTARVLEEMSQYNWQDLIDQGVVKQLVMPVPGGSQLELTFTYLGHEALGEFFIGRTAYARAERDASSRLGGAQMILLAVGGEGFGQFRQDRLTIQQGDAPTRRVLPNRLVTAGNADAGMITNRAEFAGAVVLDDWIDPTQPINFTYQPLGSLEPYELSYQAVGIGLQLAQNDPILSEREIASILRAENSAILKFFNDPPWGVTPWDQVILLSLVFTLALAAFFTKRAALRWTALTATLVYLGIIDGGFLSVSHITGAATQGPSIFLNNLPVLMIVVFTLVTTLIWGRLFCSALCPFGAVQDIITRFTPKRWLAPLQKSINIPKAWHLNGLYVKYAILAFILVMAVGFNNVKVFPYFEPFGTLFFLSGSAVLFAILAAILLACVVVPRFYCRYVCPLGAALGVVSLVSPLRIKRVKQCTVCTVCEHACPTGAIQREKIDFKECVRCDVCEDKLIKKAGSCRHDMDRIIIRHKELRAP